MDSMQVSIRTISPLYIPIELKTGANRSSAQYSEFQAKLNSDFETVILPQSMGKSTEYESIEQDSWDHRLFVWQNAKLAPNIEIHVFPNNIGIAVIDLKLDYHKDATALEKQAQLLSTELIEDVYAVFIERLGKICASQHGDYYCMNPESYDEPNIFWVSRALLMESNDLASSVHQELVTNWLSHTYRPKDAADILAGKLSYSLTWLNYVVVDLDYLEDERLDSMILAQYYYSAQENCNKLLKQAIDMAYSKAKNTEAQQKLSRSRVITRLHQVDYHDHLKYLTRTKRQKLEDILDCWSYAQLTENGQRMIEICSSKIDETENEKRERSSLLTDLLLVALSFFTVFELSLYLTELSREMMSRPTLDFNDDSRSFMLQFIAEIDTDVMFGSGFFLTLLLVFIYKIIKSR